MSKTSDSSPFWWIEPEEYAEALAATAPDASGSAPAWLEEILQTAGDISPATATEIRVAAGHGYQRFADKGDAWAQCNARNSAQHRLAVIATQREPDVQAARRAFDEAVAAAGGVWAAGDWVDPQAALLWDKYSELCEDAFGRHITEVRQAWRDADMDFLTSHRAELQAVSPAGFENLLRELTSDSSPATGPAPAPRPAGPSGTAAHHAQAAADNSQDGPGTTKCAGGRPSGLGTRVAVPGFDDGGPPEPGPARPLDQARRLIVQAGEACTHLAAIAPDGPAAAQEATKIIGLLSQVRDLAAGQYAHDPEDTSARGIRVARPAASPVRRAADRNSPAGQARPGRRRLCPPVPAPVQVDAIIAASLIAAAGTANSGKFPQPAR